MSRVLFAFIRIDTGKILRQAFHFSIVSCQRWHYVGIIVLLRISFPEDLKETYDSLLVTLAKQFLHAPVAFLGMAGHTLIAEHYFTVMKLVSWCGRGERS